MDVWRDNENFCPKRFDPSEETVQRSSFGDLTIYPWRWKSDEGKYWWGWRMFDKGAEGINWEVEVTSCLLALSATSSSAATGPWGAKIVSRACWDEIIKTLKLRDWVFQLALCITFCVRVLKHGDLASYQANPAHSISAGMKTRISCLIFLIDSSRESIFKSFTNTSTSRRVIIIHFIIDTLICLPAVCFISFRSLTSPCFDQLVWPAFCWDGDSSGSISVS